MTRVLLVTASFGEGHNQAAHAVAQSLTERGAEVTVVDYTEWLHPAFRSFAKFSLLQGVQRLPALYGVFYRSMSKMEPSSTIQRQINHLGLRQLKLCLRQVRPHIVVSTFPSPIRVLAELRQMGLTRVPNVAVVTDYTAHRQWVTRHTDAYFVATDTVRREFESFGAPANRVVVTGLPVRAQFSDSMAQQLLRNRSSLRQAHRLDSSQPLVLLMGGGAGLLWDTSGWGRLIREIRAQFVIICGNNQRLLKRFETLRSSRVQVLGYTNMVHEWMAMSDLVVTKAGAITVTEALAMELPMLLYRPIPGQEVENAEFAVSTGAAKLVHDLKAAELFLKSAVRDGNVLERMRAAARAQTVRGASDRIADGIVRLLARQNGKVPQGENAIPNFS